MRKLLGAVLLSAGAIVAALAPATAWTQAAAGGTDGGSQPSGRVIRFILPVATGSGVDTITRAAAPSLGRALGGNIVVDNQPGAGGVIGTAAMIRSAPDGNTLSVVSNNHVIYPSVLKSVPFDPVRDITPIAVMGTTPIVLVVHPKVPATNAKEMVALLKARPRELNYASSGNGTILHLAAQQFLDAADVKATHVPYKGVGPMVADLLGGQVEFGAVALPSVQGHLKSGALRAIGMATRDRVAAAPDIPTFVEQGLDYVSEAWFAVIGPKGLAPAEVQRIHAAVVDAFATPEVRDAMARQGNAIAISSPEAAARHFSDELAKYADLVRKAGLEPQ